jgi:hypothetical protein
MMFDAERPIARPRARMAAPYRCTMCKAIVPREEAIEPESASVLVRLCNLECHDAWRRSGSVAERLAAHGEGYAL